MVFLSFSSVYVYQITSSLTLPSPTKKTQQKEKMDTCTFKVLYTFKTLNYLYVLDALTLHVLIHV